VAIGIRRARERIDRNRSDRDRRVLAPRAWA
jgi:hypothetical protein